MSCKEARFSGADIGDKETSIKIQSVWRIRPRMKGREISFSWLGLE